MGSVIYLAVLVISRVYAQEKAENLTITAPGFKVNFRVLYINTRKHFSVIIQGYPQRMRLKRRPKTLKI